MAKSKIHIICGTCGNNQDLTYRVNKLSKIESEDMDDMEYSVCIVCPNCSTLHFLDEFLDLDQKE